MGINITTVKRRRDTQRSFLAWYKMGDGRQPWRLSWYTDDVNPPADAIHQLEEESGSDKFRNFFAVERRSDLSPKEFTLDLYVHCRRGRSVTIGRPSWWIPETCKKSVSKEWKECPYVWFAQNRPARELDAPFDAQDPTFIAALRHTIEDIGGADAIDGEPNVPEAALLRKLAHHYRALIAKNSKAGSPARGRS